MHLATVIGTVWATRKYETLEGGKLLILQPKDEKNKPQGNPIIAVDTVGAGSGETVFFVTAREAIIAFKKDLNYLCPVDAAIVGIVDFINDEER